MGRNLNFTPEELWDLFENEYIVWAEANPIKVEEQKRGSGVSIPKNADAETISAILDMHSDTICMNVRRPVSLEGFEAWTYKNKKCCIEQYFKNPDANYPAFVPVVTRIRKWIRADHIEGGMSGLYNASITARLNGLTEKTEITQKTVRVSWKKSKDE